MGQRVLDTETGEVVVLPEADAEAGLRSGRYAVSATHGGPIGLVDESGERYEVDPENLGGALESGLHIETPEQAEEADRERRFGASPVQSFAEGALRELVPGADQLTAALLSAQGVRSVQETMEARQERAARNPVASGAGRVVGAVAPALVTGGASQAARGGARGVLGALARATPGGAAAAIGEGAAETLARRGAGRLASTLSGAAADGALSGIAESMADAGLEGRPIEAEQVIGNGLFGAILGLGAGGVFHAGAAGVRGAGRLAETGTERLRSYADDLARAGLGEGAATRQLRGGIEAAVVPRATEEGVQGALRSLSRRVSGVDPDDLAVIAAQPRRAFDAQGFERVSREAAEAADTLGTRVDEAAEALASAERRQAALSSAAEGVDQATARQAARTALEGVQGRIRDGLEAFDGRGSSGRALRGLAGEVETALGRVDSGSTAEALGAVGDAVQAVERASGQAGSDGASGLLAELRTTLTNVASDPDAFGRAGTTFAELEEARRAWSDAREALRVDQANLARELTDRGAASGEAVQRVGESLEAAEGVLDAAERAGADVGDARAAMSRTRETLARAIELGEVRGAALRGIDAEGGGALAALAARGVGAATGRAGGILGALVGGAPGYAAGQSLGSVAEALVEASTRPVSTYQRISRIGEAVSRYEPRVQRGVERLRRALESGSLERAAHGATRTTSRVVLSLRGSPDERREEYQQASEQLRRLATSPDALEGRLGQTVGPVADVHPALAEHLALTTMRGVRYLTESLPPADQYATLYGDDIDPSQFEVDGFLRRLEVIEDPALAIDLAAEGALQVDHVEALSAVHPEIYADISARVSEVLGELDEPPPYPLRVQLGTLLDVPADPTMTPEMIDTLQSRYAHTGAQYDAQNTPQVHRTGSLARLGSTFSGQAQTEAQDLAGSI